MGIKHTNIESFLEPESQGFFYDTARSFLKRHSNPESLLSQLKNLLAQGQPDSCRDLIQLIIREGHSLADNSSIYLLRAKIAFEQAENIGEVMAWLQQAKLCENQSTEICFWDDLMQARTAIKEGDVLKGQVSLEKLKNNKEVGHFAKYELAHYLFWHQSETNQAIALLEEITNQNPEFIKAWSCLGFAYNKIGMKQKAQEAFGNCIELDSNPERLKLYRQQLAS